MTQQTQDVVLQMSRRFEAPRERVFEAWTSPEVLKDWWRVGPDWSTPVAEVDLRPGGTYRLAMTDTDGMTHTVVGEYREVNPPERLVYTWSWEGDESVDVVAGSRGSVVTVVFVDDAGATTVELTHTGFASDEIRDKHVHGWAGVMSNLERVLSAG